MRLVPSPRSWRRAALLVTLAGAAAIGSAGCIDLSTDPDEIVAIQMDELPWPAVVAGDTLRDAMGVAAPLGAQVFDAAGDLVDIPVEFIARDTLVTVTASGLVIARDSVDGASEILASVPQIQSTVRRLEVVPRPDSIEATATIDTLRWVIPDAPATNVSSALSVRLLNRTATGVQGVRAWVVQFRLEFRGAPVPPGDTTLVWLVDESGRPRTADTTDAQGHATRRVRLRTGPGLNPLDSAVVFVDAQYQGVPVAGSPLRLVVPMVPRTAAAAPAPSAAVSRERRLPE